MSTSGEKTHTPGPWHVCNKGGCSCFTVMSGDHPIAQVTHGDWGDDYPALRLVGDSALDLKAEAYMEQITYGSVDDATARANWHLIAAAPELLGALECLLADCEEYSRINNLHNADGSPATNHAMRRAAAAIALATPAEGERT